MITVSKRAALVFGIGLGVVGGAACAYLFGHSTPRLVHAAAADRYQDSIICTGAVSLSPRVQLDGVWMIDYKAGKLLGTCIDKTQGRIVGWAEVDLVSEFEVAPRQDVHFMMATGYITAGQAALYVAETVTGKFGVYTMSGAGTGPGVVIKRHDMTSFRKTADAIQAGAVLPAAAEGAGFPERPVPAPAAPGVVPGNGLVPAMPVPAPQPALPVGGAGVPLPPSGGAAVPTLPTVPPPGR